MQSKETDRGGKMTEIREATGTCIMGRSTEHPCTYPATESIRRWDDGAPVLCAFHAATEPLSEEADALALGLDLFEDWEANARQHDNEPLLELLGRARAEFSGRLERANKVLDDLRAAEFKLMRS
jgi:hypothetical protein